MENSSTRNGHNKASSPERNGYDAPMRYESNGKSLDRTDLRVTSSAENRYDQKTQSKREYNNNSPANEGSDINGYKNNSLNGCLHTSPRSQQETVIVVGTGDLGRGLVTRLTSRGYRVVTASRDPEKNRLKVERAGGEIASYANALKQGKVVIIAIPSEGYSTLPVDLFEGKVVVDVSNRPMKHKGDDQSQAVKLQKMLTSSKVVKAFNTLSAYGLQNNLLQGSKEVPVCSNSEGAKQIVMSLVRNLGFTPVDRGNLSNAKEIESITLAFFPDWRLAAKLSLGIFIFSFLVQFFRKQLCPNFQRPGNEPWNWKVFKTFLLMDFQVAFGLSAITLLATCYLPGVIAAYLQLFRGTKYSEFPKWLDNWLRSRKQIGLITQLCATMHMFMAILILIDEGIKDDWTSYVYLTFGCFSMGLMTILAIMSLPSVSETLTWREFSVIQRYLGWWALVCAVLHLMFKKWHKLLVNGQACVIIPEVGQLFIILPLITVLLKIFLILPCIDNHLLKIRRGYERSSKNKSLA